MKKYETIEQVWSDIDSGKTIFWSNELYKVIPETIIKDNSFQENHFTRKGNTLLSVRCIENYFGSVMDKTDLRGLYSL